MSIRFHDGLFHVRLAGKTDIGQVRKRNEDAFAVGKTLPLVVISDGMGGHAHGDVASSLAAETIVDFYESARDLAPQTWPFHPPEFTRQSDHMAMAIKLANQRIFQQGAQHEHGMGCTVDAIYFSRGHAYIGHVGDSRIYRLRGSELNQVTLDHSLHNDWRRVADLETGEALPYQAQRNVVVRALGLSAQVFVDVHHFDVELGDVYLLCSDGLSGMVSDAEIAEVLRGPGNQGLDQLCSQLVDLANRNGGGDNITAALARIEEEAGVPPPRRPGVGSAGAPPP